MLPHRVAPAGTRGTLRYERDRLVEDRGVAARDQVLGQCEQRPEHDVAVRVAGTNGGVALEEHEPLRPVAVGLLRFHHAQQQVAHRCAVAVREQQLHGALAHVARAPATARELLEPARGEVVDEGVLAQPGQQLDEAPQPGRCGVVVTRGDREPRRQAAGDEVGAVGRWHVGTELDQSSDDREARAARRRGGEHQVRQLARRSVAEQQLVATEPFDRRVVARRLDAPVALREALREIAARGWRKHHGPSVAPRVHAPSRTTVVAVERDV